MTKKKVDELAVVEEFAECCEKQDAKGCIERLAELHECCEEDNKKPKGATASQSSVDLDDCLQRVETCKSEATQQQDAANSPKGAATHLDPATWMLIFELGSKLIQFIRSQRAGTP